MAESIKDRFPTFIHFAVVVDGEVASHIAFPPEDEKNRAIYNSNPIFIEVPYEERPLLGSIWDGEKFIVPEGLI